jgi:hypothetical protein
MSQFPHERNRLQPSKTFFDSLSFLLTDGLNGCRVVLWSIALPPFAEEIVATLVGTANMFRQLQLARHSNTITEGCPVRPFPSLLVLC